MPPLSFLFLRARALVASGACLAALGACESAVAPLDLTEVPGPALALARGGGMSPPPVAPTFSTKTPEYPAIAVYIVYREYVHRNPGLTSLDPDDRRYQQYMEKRLRELYPQRGYAGMMRDAVAEARRYRQQWQQFERETREYERLMRAPGGALSGMESAQCTGGWVDPNAGADPSWTGTEEHPVPPDDYLPTVQMEIDSLRLTGDEVQDILYFESLATGTYAPGGGGGGGGTDPILMYGIDPAVTLDDLIRAAGEGLTPHGGEMSAQLNPVVFAAGATLVIGWASGAYKIYRATQSEKRANHRSQLYYSHQHPENTQRDAFRHIYVSVLLRRYVGGAVAKAVTDYHENNNPNEPPARVMDLHNNDIGRVYRYNSFRGHWLWDRWDEGLWAQKVRNYIDAESSNGDFIFEWSAEPLPTLAEAWAREACVPREKYIFFSRG